MGWLTGFEPATPRTTTWCSNRAELQPPYRSRSGRAGRRVCRCRARPSSAPQLAARLHAPRLVASVPAPTCASVAQLAEQRILNPRVEGSIPSGGTIPRSFPRGNAAARRRAPPRQRSLASARDSGSWRRPCPAIQQGTIAGGVTQARAASEPRRRGEHTAAHDAPGDAALASMRVRGRGAPRSRIPASAAPAPAASADAGGTWCRRRPPTRRRPCRRARARSRARCAGRARCR